MGRQFAACPVGGVVAGHLAATVQHAATAIATRACRKNDGSAHAGQAPLVVKASILAAKESIAVIVLITPRKQRPSLTRTADYSVLA
jgi:hypothetical protein